MSYHVIVNGFEVRTDTLDELMSIVRGPLLSRRKITVELDPEPEPPAPAKRSSAHGHLGETFEALRPHWGVLAARQLEAVKLRMEGKSTEEIARLMGNSEKSVSVLLNLSRRRLEAARDGKPSGTRAIKRDEKEEP